MNIDSILSEIDAEIARLQQAKALLGSTTSSVSAVAKRKPGRPPASASATSQASKTIGKRRMMSPEGRAKIAAAQKARWAKSKKAAGGTSKKKVGRPAKSSKKATSAKPETTAA